MNDTRFAVTFVLPEKLSEKNQLELIKLINIQTCKMSLK